MRRDLVCDDAVFHVVLIRQLVTDYRAVTAKVAQTDAANGGTADTKAVAETAFEDAVFVLARARRDSWFCLCVNPGFGSMSLTAMKSELKIRLLQNLADAYSSKELRVNPEFQRGIKWSLPQKQGLIDSLLRDYRIPLFYVHLESRTNEYTRDIEKTAWIVDGQQRLPP